ncbi:hypothetical protein [Mycoplasma sp. P36-A1]|uniref:hypothetical protein n=1 Tax=Mycoplasma sp. P36-A1 TaxID=3252900 RepID=UPI003C2B6D78
MGTHINNQELAQIDEENELTKYIRERTSNQEDKESTISLLLGYKYSKIMRMLLTPFTILFIIAEVLLLFLLFKHQVNLTKAILISIGYTINVFILLPIVVNIVRVTILLPLNKADDYNKLKMKYYLTAIVVLIIGFGVFRFLPTTI